jgi:hypothetical protein
MDPIRRIEFLNIELSDITPSPAAARRARPNVWGDLADALDHRGDGIARA